MGVALVGEVAETRGGRSTGKQRTCVVVWIGKSIERQPHRHDDADRDMAVVPMYLEEQQ